MTEVRRQKAEGGCFWFQIWDFGLQIERQSAWGIAHISEI